MGARAAADEMFLQHAWMNRKENGLSCLEQQMCKVNGPGISKIFLLAFSYPLEHVQNETVALLILIK